MADPKDTKTNSSSGKNSQKKEWTWNIDLDDAGKMLASGISAAAPFITGGNHTVLGDLGMGIGSAVATVNPYIGAAITGVSALGNAAFGSNLDQGAVNNYRRRILDFSHPQITAQDNNQLLNQIGNQEEITLNKKALGTQGWFSHKVDDEYNSLLGDLKAAGASRDRLISDAASNVDKMNDARIAMNYKAFGGPMFGYLSDGAIAYDMARDNLMAKLWNAQNKKQADLGINAFAAGGLLSDNFTNGVTEIGAGGSHEKNPYNGVPMGIAEDGQPNLVEEGEAIFNDYVFSNRLKVPKAVRNKYKLRGPKNMTFAEAFLNAQKESEERENDPISKNGLDNIAMILMQAQEGVRAKKAAKRFAHGGHLFLFGSELYPPYDPGSMTPEEYQRIYGAYPEGYENGNWTAEELERVAGTATTGTTPPPVVSSTTNAAINTNAPESIFEGGSDEGDFYTGNGVYSIQPGATVSPKKPKSTNLNAGASANLLRFAEPFGNMYAVWSDATGRTNNPVTYDYIPDYTPLSFTPIGEYMPELHLDTRYAANQQAQQAAATKAAILDNILPNRYANLLAADYNAQTAYGDLLRNAEIAEYDNLLKARTFNRGTDQYNSEMDAKVAEDDAARRLAYAQAKFTQAKANTDETNASMGARAANIKALTTSLANIGRERDAYNWRDMLMRAGVFGTLSEKPANWNDKQWKAYQDNLKIIQDASVSAFGGKLKKKKKGGFTY